MKQLHQNIFGDMELYVVMARYGDKSDSRLQDGSLYCHCVCDSHQTARDVIDKDTRNGDILPGAYVDSHVLQTPELV